MRKRSLFAFLSLVCIGLIFTGASYNKQAVSKTQVLSQEHSQKTKLAVDMNFGKMPLYFIENKGQMDDRVHFYIKGSKKSIYFTSEGLTYVLSKKIKDPVESEEKNDSVLMNSKENDQPDSINRWVVKLDFLGARNSVQPVGLEETPAKISYFRGKPDQWQTGLATYSKIIYKDLWPGIDLIYTGTLHKMKYEFLVHPGADPAQIKLAYSGAESVALSPEGRLQITIPIGGFEDDVPIGYQEVEGQKVDVKLAFSLENSQASMNPDQWVYGFKVGDYDPALPLVLDPVVLVYCGFIGGSYVDQNNGIAVDGAGNAYVVGDTYSDATSFPVSGGPDLIYNAVRDAFVAKVNAAGTSLVFCGYIGGSSDDSGQGIAVDGSGNAYVTGNTYSDETTFPVTIGPDLTYDGPSQDAFVAKVNASGTSLDYCGYIGGSSDDSGQGIAVDGSGNAYVAGYTNSPATSFPVTGGPDLTKNGGIDVFVAKVNTSGTSLDYCGYIGGSGGDYGYGIAVDGSGNVYVTGITASMHDTFPVVGGPDLTYGGGTCDAFIAKVNASGSALTYCGYIGSASNDYGKGVAVDGSGNAYITGYTGFNGYTFTLKVGPDLTYNGGDHDAFAVKVNASGSGFDYSGYIGGDGDDRGNSIAVDGSGNAYVTGSCDSDETTFPVVAGPDLTFNGFYDVYVAKVNASGGGLAYCGYIGGLSNDECCGIAVDSLGNAYLGGYTNSDDWDDFPVITGPDQSFNGQYDAFVAKVVVEFVEVTLPNGGESWEEGTAHNITWTSSGTFDNVRIEYSWNNGTSWTQLYASTPNDGSFTWTVPDSPSTQCLVRISDAADGDPSDTSDAVFTIFYTPIVPPTVTTGAASDVTTNSATLNGSVNPNGKSTTYYFEFGLNTSYGMTTSGHSAGAGSTDVPVSNPITALSSNTTYHYRLVATNADGTSYGEDQTFTTGIVIKTWSGINRLTWNSGDSCIPSIAADPSSNVHVVWHDDSPGNNEIMYKRSTDGGTTWGGLKRITWNSGSSKMPVIAQDCTNVYLAWYDDSSSNDEIMFKKSTDGGSTWGAITRITWNAGSSIMPAIAAVGGYVHLVWNDDSSGNDEILYKRSTDQGSTWGAITRITWNTGDSRSVTAAVDICNRVSLAWYDNSSGNDEILYKRSTDGGSTWGGLKRITWNTGSSSMPFLAINPHNNDVYLIWNDDSFGNDEIIFKKSTDGGSTWGALIRMTWNGGASFKPVIAVDLSNGVHIAWYDDSPGNNEIYYKQSTDGGSTWGALFRMTWNSGSSMVPAMAVDSGNNLYLVWQDHTPGNFEIYNKNKK